MSCTPVDWPDGVGGLPSFRTYRDNMKDCATVLHVPHKFQFGPVRTV